MLGNSNRFKVKGPIPAPELRHLGQGPEAMSAPISPVPWEVGNADFRQTLCGTHISRQSLLCAPNSWLKRDEAGSTVGLSTLRAHCVRSVIKDPAVLFTGRGSSGAVGVAQERPESRQWNYTPRGHCLLGGPPVPFVHSSLLAIGPQRWALFLCGCSPLPGSTGEGIASVRGQKGR